MKFLVACLNVSIGYQTNVAGVFDRPPEENGAGLVREISVKPGERY
jgi:hypothetical protein